MGQVMSLLYGLFFFGTSLMLVCVAALITLVTAPFDPNRRIVHYFSCWWASLYIWSNPFWKVTIDGRENIDANKAYVLVSNHQSYTDIIVLYHLFKPFKWVSKEEIFSVPAIGWNMRLNQYVLLKRGNLSSIKEMLQTCKDWLKRGASVMIFPEGTRSPDGEIHDFRDGSFRLAVDCGVPVVPIVIDGTHDILPKGGKAMKFKADIRVKVLPPVEPGQFENSAKLRNHVHNLMKTTLAEMRAHKAPVLVR